MRAVSQKMNTKRDKMKQDKIERTDRAKNNGKKKENNGKSASLIATATGNLQKIAKREVSE